MTPQLPNTPEPDDNSKSRLFDLAGRPVPQTPTFPERLRRLSAKTKIIAISITALVTGTAVFLTNIQKIREHFRPSSAPVTVPAITVKLSNSKDTAVVVIARGDFMLWLPGPGVRHTIGKYELQSQVGTSPTDGQITVPPQATVTVVAHVMNQEFYGRVLAQRERDISLMIRRSKGGLTFTESLPFTEDAIRKYHLSADVGVENSRPTAVPPENAALQTGRNASQAINQDEVPPERFVDNVNGTITDTKTNLMWAKSDTRQGINLENSQRYCAELSLGGHADWRLPRVGELESLYDTKFKWKAGGNYVQIDPVFRLTGTWFWSSDVEGSSDSWYFSFSSGAPGRKLYTGRYDTANYGRALPVRNTGEAEGRETLSGENNLGENESAEAVRSSPELTVARALGTVEKAQESPTVVDTRDHRVYRTMRIGRTEWMAENLNFVSENTFCYDDQQSNCDRYGRLYDFQSARRACPESWRLPFEVDWRALIRAFEITSKDPVFQLFEGGSTGFDVPLGGLMARRGRYKAKGRSCYYWTDNGPNGSSQKFARGIAFATTNSGFAGDRYFLITGYSVDDGFYVRCIK